jgi:hypothetical protein
VVVALRSRQFGASVLLVGLAPVCLPWAAKRRLSAAVATSCLLLAACTSTPSEGLASRKAVASTKAVALTGTLDLAAGFNGGAGWRVTRTQGFEVTSDGGKTWTRDPLPAVLSVSDIQDVQARPGGGILIAAGAGNSAVTVLSQSGPAALWTMTTVIPRWPNDFPPPEAASAFFAQSPAGRVSLLIGEDSTHSTEFVGLFESTDSGRSFVQLRTGGGAIWTSITFASARDGVAVVGAADRYQSLVHTRDGGATWIDSTMPPGLSRVSLSQPVTTSSGFQVVATAPSADGTSSTVTVLHSSDGRLFERVGTALTTPSEGVVTIAAAAGIVWVFVGNHTLVTSDDSGATWSRVSGPTIPDAAESAGLTTATTGSTAVGDGSCLANKTDCTSTVETFTTHDGGRTWTVQ